MPSEELQGQGSHAPDVGLAMSLSRHKIGVQTLYLEESHDGARLYKRAGVTDSLEEMVDHDGPVIIEGVIGHVVDDDGIETFYHPDAGRMVGPSCTELPDSTALKLVEVEPEPRRSVCGWCGEVAVGPSATHENCGPPQEDSA